VHAVAAKIYTKQLALIISLTILGNICEVTKTKVAMETLMTEGDSSG